MKIPRLSFPISSLTPKKMRLVKEAVEAMTGRKKGTGIRVINEVHTNIRYRKWSRQITPKAAGTIVVFRT